MNYIFLIVVFKLVASLCFLEPLSVTWADCMSAEEINIYLYSMSWMCMYKCESKRSIPDSSLRVSCVLVKPCSTPSTLSSYPLPLRLSLRLFLTCIMAGASEWARERVCEAGSIEKRDDLTVQLVAEKQPGFHHSPLFSFFLPHRMCNTTVCLTGVPYTYDQTKVPPPHTHTCFLATRYWSRLAPAETARLP